MKIAPALVLFLSILSVLQANERIKNVELISPADAEAVIVAQKKAKADRRAEVQALIDSAYVQEEFVHQKEGERKIVLRRVKPSRALLEAAKETPVEKFDTKKPTHVVTPSLVAEIDDYILEHLSLLVTNYDDLYSRVKWRYEDQEYEIWSNIQLTYMHSIGDFKYNGINYNYFGFFDMIESDVS